MNLHPDDVEQTGLVDFDSGTATYGYTPLHRQIQDAYSRRRYIADREIRKAWDREAQRQRGGS